MSEDTSKKQNTDNDLQTGVLPEKEGTPQAKANRKAIRVVAAIAITALIFAVVAALVVLPLLFSDEESGMESNDEQVEQQVDEDEIADSQVTDEEIEEADEMESTVEMNPDIGPEADEADPEADSDENPREGVPQVYTSSGGRNLVLDSPDLDKAQQCTFEVRGEVSGGWFFEGSALIELVSVSGDVVDDYFMIATENWMTSDPVEFIAEISCSGGDCSQVDTMRFVRSNPSDDSSNDDNVSVPIEFRGSC
jgi:hypothetical protein